jgi:hypothetical protein
MRPISNLCTSCQSPLHISSRSLHRVDQSQAVLTHCCICRVCPSLHSDVLGRFINAAKKSKSNWYLRLGISPVSTCLSWLSTCSSCLALCHGLTATLQSHYYNPNKFWSPDDAAPGNTLELWYCLAQYHQVQLLMTPDVNRDIITAPHMQQTLWKNISDNIQSSCHGSTHDTQPNTTLLRLYPQHTTKHYTKMY